MNVYEHQQQFTNICNRRSKRIARSLCYTMARHTPTGISIRVSSPLTLLQLILANERTATGHALNKITKDIINRSKLIQGNRVQCVGPRSPSSARADPRTAPATSQDTTRMAYH